MTLLTPALLLLLLAFSGCFSEVVDDFSDESKCRQFIADPGGVWSPPTIFTGAQYKPICQIRENTYEYATLYDTANRIPVYSAYKFEGLIDCRNRSKRWFVEPQLDDPNGNKKMRGDRGVVQLPNQAVNKDYEGTRVHGYDRGHLAPVRHASSKSCLEATFTLTNAAPQKSNFNQVVWRDTERNVANILIQKCENNDRYIVTGVVPGTQTLKNRVRIPSHFWTAYCCLNNNENRTVTASGSFIGTNDQNSNVVKMTVAQLDTKLTDYYGKGTFAVFGGKCNEPESVGFKMVDLNMKQRLQCLKIRNVRERSRCIGKTIPRRRVHE